MDNTPDSLYEFGFGKSYSTFTYSNLTMSTTNATSKDKVKVSVRVTNSSQRDGQEVVQLYVEDLIATVAVPNKQLKGFKKVLIKVGESKDVDFDIKIEDLGLWNVK